jgi:hypothetical protein
MTTAKGELIPWRGDGVVERGLTGRRAISPTELRRSRRSKHLVPLTLYHLRALDLMS